MNNSNIAVLKLYRQMAMLIAINIYTNIHASTSGFTKCFVIVTKLFKIVKVSFNSNFKNSQIISRENFQLKSYSLKKIQ